MEKIKSELTRLRGIGLSYKRIADQINKELEGTGLKVSWVGIRAMLKRDYAIGINKEKEKAILAVGRRFK
jgi:hypothetical protein